MSCIIEEQKVFYYPSYSENSENKFETINLDKTSLNFKEIVNKIDQNSNETFIEFNDGKNIKKIKAFVHNGGFIKRKNVLQISTDSVLIDNGYLLSDLKNLMKRHFLNKGKIKYYSDSVEKAIIEISINPNKNANELKETLKKLTLEFDNLKKEINERIELFAFFSYFRFEKINIPPPPMELE
ncbi:hypothetical protein [Polaribacter sp.]|uniref:hypothetical protein n=1 Tax=Polaribacter sp. TaxID=1920175 RepID=UPI003EF3A71B